MPKRILHIDMDAFFASVEQVRNPSLKGKPLIIGGDRTDTRGVVSTASYEARPFGVHSGMPLAQAKRLCPHAVFMRGNFSYYLEASQKVRAILDQVSPLVEMASIDEAYVDVTGSQRLFGGDDAIASLVKNHIHEETGLPCTIAVAPNRLVAKVAANQVKPDGYCRINAGEEAAFLAPLPLAELPGVGPRTREMLESMGIMSVGALANLPVASLLAVFGPGGYGLQRAAMGISSAEISLGSRPRSISRETTFTKDLLDWPHIERVLTYLTERASFALRQQGMETRCVTLKVRYNDFQTHTFAKSLPDPVSLDRFILEALHGLIPKAKARRAQVRLIGVALSALSYNQQQLLLLSAPGTEKWERAFESVDHVRVRHGFQYIRTARSMALGREVDLSTPSLSR